MSNPLNPEGEYVVIAQGNLSRGDRQLALDFLGHLGLETSVMTAGRYAKLLEAGVYPGSTNSDVITEDTQRAGEPLTDVKPFEAITSRDDYLVREHFEEFRTRFVAEEFPARKIVGGAFNGCLDIVQGGGSSNPWHQGQKTGGGAGEHLKRLAERPSLYPTLRSYPYLNIRTRTELGLPPFQFPNRSGYTSGARAIRLARYAIGAGGFADLHPQLERRGKLNRIEKFINLMSTQVAAQLES